MGCSQRVQRFGSVIGVKEKALEKYKKMHTEPWPEVNAQLKKSSIQNYSILSDTVSGWELLPV